MANKVPLSTTSAICLAIVFFSSLTVSIFNYPRPWSIMTTFLSDFGNMKVNPLGALIYNAGVHHDGGCNSGLLSRPE